MATLTETDRIMTKLANAQALDQEEGQILSQMVYDGWKSQDPVKQAASNSAVDEYTRIAVREDGILPSIIPPVPIDNSQLDRRMEDAMPAKIVDIETDSPGAFTVGFNTTPTTYYIRMDRYPITFDRVMSPRYTADVDELRTNHMDVRMVLNDHAIKDMLAEYDNKLFSAVDTALIGADTLVPATGAVQWQTIHGGIERNGVVDSLKILPSGDGALQATTLVLNHITALDFLKWAHDETGGGSDSDSAKMFRHGFELKEVFGRKIIVTIKRGLVGNGTIYHFANPEFLGKNFTLTEPTMYVRREAFMIDFFSYSCSGIGFGHAGGVGRSDHVN